MSSNTKEYAKAYFQKNKARLLAQHYQWRRENPDKVRQQYRRRIERIKKDPIRLAKLRGYYKRHRLENLQKAKARLQTPRGKFFAYRRTAKNRGLPFELSMNDFEKLWQKSCYYCGRQIKTIGLDRIDSKKGYFRKNVRPCCEWCNKMKNTRSESQFLKQCQKIVRKHKL